MKLPGKLGDLLGKNDYGSGSSFHLEDIMLKGSADEAKPFTPNSTEIAPLKAQNEAETTISAEDTSIDASPDTPLETVFDLEFLSEPLEELNSAPHAAKAAEIALTSDSEAPSNNESLAPELAVTPLMDSSSATYAVRDRAIAESLLLDQNYSYAIFDQSGNVIEITDSLLEMIQAPPETWGAARTYTDLLEIMAAKADLGDKDVQALLRKEAVNMPHMAAKKKFQVFKWNTLLKSGRTLQFKNKYTPSGNLVTVASDVTKATERDRILRIGLELGNSGYWSYHFSSKKSVWGGYFADLMKEKQLNLSESDHISSLVHPDDSERVLKAYEEAVNTGRRLEIDFKINTHADAETHLRLVGQAEHSPISSKAEMFVAYITDITEEKKRAVELQETKELSKSRSDFLSRMSHEIKTPLNAIVGMTEVLRDEVDSDEARETAQFISDAAESLNTILSQTLEHERLASTELVLDEHTVRIHDVARSVIAMWKKPCEDKGVDLKLRLSPNLPEEIILDQSRFRQCLTNLLSNSVKFTSKGSIILALGVSATSQAEGAQLVVGVRDTGIGMSEDAAAKIFKPFQQADASIRTRFGGSGLGMSITQHIVSAMQGQIKVKSVEGQGTTIAISLPLRTQTQIAAAPQSAELPAEIQPVQQIEEVSPAPVNIADAAPETEPQITTASAATPPTIPSPTPQKQTLVSPAIDIFHQAQTPPANPGPSVIKNKEIHPSDYSGFDILIVEDNPINQAVVRKLLVNHIKSMTFAFHGQEALEALEQRSFDVILMDIHMPVKDGIETTLEIRNSGKPWADTTIIALTADPDFQQKRVCRNIGMNDALSKPVRRQDLLDVMQKVLDERKIKTENLKMQA